MNTDPEFAPLWTDHLPAGQSPLQARAAEQAAGQEEAAVKYVLALLGEDLSALRRRARERSGTGRLDFLLFGEVYPDFPVRLVASRLRFDYDGVATDLFDDVRNTPMFDAWSEHQARHAAEGGYVVLVFKWPRVRRCRNFCVFHGVPRHDEELWPAYPDGRPAAARSDPRYAWRLALPDREFGVFSIEPLPAFLAALGVLRDGVRDDD